MSIFKLPFVSRDRYEETKARLEREISELKAERVQLMNRITAPVFGGIGLLESIPKEVFTQPAEVPQEQGIVSEVQDALRKTGGNVRRAADMLTRKNEVKYDHETTKALEIIDEALASGRASATTGNA